MKKNRPEKNKTNISISKNPYCVVLENAGKRTRQKGCSAEPDGWGGIYPKHPKN